MCCPFEIPSFYEKRKNLKLCITVCELQPLRLRYAQGDKVNVILRNEVTKNLDVGVGDFDDTIKTPRLVPRHLPYKYGRYGQNQILPPMLAGEGDRLRWWGCKKT